MSETTVFSVRERVTDLIDPTGFGPLLEILAVFTPIGVLGYVGTRVGTDTYLGGAIVNLAYALGVLVGWGLLRRRGSGWLEIGLARPKSWLRTVLLGIGALFGAIIAITAVQVIALNLPGVVVEPLDQSRFDPLIGNLPWLLLMVTLAWTTIAFGEEMIYRAFLINRLSGLFHNIRFGKALTVFGSATAFGLAHYMAEGPLGFVSNGAFGLLFAWIYLRTGNLWVTIIAHGLANTLRIVMVYAGAVA